MQHQIVTAPARPSRAQIEPAALELLSRHSAGLLATARRYSATPEDAEDAYQRGVEILLTKAPTTTEDELLPWLKTVIKHESFAVRKATGRSLHAEEPPDGDDWAVTCTDERAERYEQLRLGAEAMAGLKPQEIRCLVLKAEGLSYREICAATGWSYTKVNRSITEGRRAFIKRVANIESGAECERLASLISKVADGEASGAEMRQLRPHIKNCLACKATLREYRATPSRIAGLVPPVVALAGGGGGAPGFFARAVAALHDRFAGMSDIGGAKVMAVAASAAVLAGGGAAGVSALDHDPPAVPASAYADTPAKVQRAANASPAQVSGGPTAPAASQAPDPSPAVIQAVSAPSDGGVNNAPTNPKPDPVAAPEFDPGTANAPGAGSDADPQRGEFTSTPAAAPLSAPTTSRPADSAPAGSTRSSDSKRSPARRTAAPGEFGP
jgi:RNA polymerase sigma factor (sigma-70 family)